MKRRVTPPYDPLPIDDFPNFKAHLGKARVDKIRFFSRQTAGSTNFRQRITPNPYLQLMQYQRAYSGNAIDDIIVGVSRLDHHSSSSATPLSVTRLYAILQCMEEISTPSLSEMLDVDTRQAQKYLKAIKIILFHIKRHLNNTPKLNLDGEDFDIEVSVDSIGACNV